MEWESKLLLGEDRLFKLQESYINVDSSAVEKIVDKIYGCFDYFKTTSKDQKDTLEFCNQFILLLTQKVDEENPECSIYSKKRLYLKAIERVLDSSYVNSSPLNTLISKMLEWVNSNLESYNLSFEISEDIKYDLCMGGYYDPYTSSITLKIGRNTLFYVYCDLNKEAFVDDFTAAYTHENTHLQQDQLEFKKQPYIEPDKKDSKEYFSQNCEIDAYARFVGYELEKVLKELRKEKTYDELSSLLTNGNLLKILNWGVDKKIISNEASATYLIYKNLPSKVFKKFLKEVYDYFEDQSKGKYDYKNWLQSKSMSIMKESVLSLI
jgi:hypothetical protein